MKLLMLNWRDLKNPKSGGAEVLTEGILKLLAEQGWDITLFSAAFPGSLPKEKVTGYTVVRKGQAFTVHFWAFIYWLKYFRHQDFDVVVDQIHGLPFFTSLYIKRAKVYGFIHEVAKEIWFRMYPFPISLLGYLSEFFYFKLYKKIPFITVSPSTKQDLLDSGIPEKHITIIPEAINFPPYMAQMVKENDPTIIYVGRIAQMKRVEELIQAAALAQKQIPNLRLWLVGKGEKDYVAKLIQQASNLNLPATFFGKVSEAKKYELLSRAWLLSSASLKEGFGLVILEAATVKTPCVVYNIKGFRDAVLHGQTGLLSKPDSEALAQNLVSLIKNRELYQTFAQNAHTHSQQFTFENAGQAFAKILNPYGT